MANDSKTGKAGGFTLAGVALTFTKWTAKSKKEMAKSTDSANYVPGTDKLWSAQLPGEESLEVTVEGNWSAANTPANFIAVLKGNATVAAVLKIDQTTTYCSGSFDLSDAEVSLAVPGAEMVTFSGTLMSNGPVTYT